MLKAVIIAAGTGNRLRRGAGLLPKPLYRVAGLPIIERVILSAKQAGIQDFVVVVGWQGGEIQKLLARHKRLGVNLEFVVNEEWERPNGFSVLKARAFLSDDFVLLMSDHIYDWKLLADLLERNPMEGGVLLAIDRRTEDVFDVTDATKVQTEGERIVRIGKEIGPYDAIDTGIFYCSVGLFGALEEVCREGNGTLSEAIQQLAKQKQARIFDIGKRYWQDIDTPEALQEAERVLLLAARKPATDGIVATYLNRKISGWISRWLVRLPVSPNQITYSSLILGLISSFLVSRGSYWAVALGGLLFQFTSIYDGCDGEVAKLKMSSSRFGEWLDTASDNLTYLSFFIGVIVGAFKQQSVPYLFPVSVAALFGVGVCFSLMLLYLLRFTRSGSLVTFQKDLMRDLSLGQPTFLTRFIAVGKFMVKRDCFAFFFMVFCLLNRPHWILISTAIGANVMWIVLLTTKREFIRSKPVLQVEE